jgi:hypothetical protein
MERDTRMNRKFLVEKRRLALATTDRGSFSLEHKIFEKAWSEIVTQDGFEPCRFCVFCGEQLCRGLVEHPVNFIHI